MILGQIIILKNNFQKIQLLQIPMTVIFSFFIDATMLLLSFVHPEFYLFKIFVLLGGTVILAAGIAAQVRANVLILPGEGLVKAIASVTGNKFGKVKTVFDISLVIISITLSIALLRKIAGLREGTVISAFLVGSTAHFFIHRFEFMERIFGDSAEEVS